jgi:hypothetical protein
MNSLPDWATVGENRVLFGQAIALGANDFILSNRDLTLGYVQAKSGGKLCQCLFIFHFPRNL